MPKCFSCFRSSSADTGGENEVVDNQNGNCGRKLPNTEARGAGGLCMPLRRAKEKQSGGNGDLQRSSENENPHPNNKFALPWRRLRRKSTTCSGGPTYDYIDSINDPVYSKVTEPQSNSHRYDYPAFGIYPPRRRPQNEPFYTSASQIYYMASDDPYSSIVSETRRNTNYELESNSSGVYDIGYEKMAVPLANVLRSESHRNAPSTSNVQAVPSTSTTLSHRGLDALYAKINRPSNNNEFVPSTEEQKRPSPNIPSTSADCFHDHMTSPLYQPAQNSHEEESGSGSVGSFYTGTGSSQNPSYRYLTVREPIDIIRERIRRQEMLNEQQREEGEFQMPHREHYYSTIANEYESVGGDERSLTGDDGPTTEAPSRNNRPRRRQVFRLFPSTSSITSPLSLFTGRFHQQHHFTRPVNVEPDVSTINGESPPRPPTSPIPNRSLEELRSLPNSRPVILSPTLPFSDKNEKSTDNRIPEMANGSAQQNNNSLHTIQNYNDVVNRSVPNFHHRSNPQRNSCSYDPRNYNNIFMRPPVELTLGNPRRDDTILTSIMTRRNRVSAPTGHSSHSRFSSSSITPPPLPPLPTPHNHTIQLLKRSSEIDDQCTNSESRNPIAVLSITSSPAAENIITSNEPKASSSVA